MVYILSEIVMNLRKLLNHCLFFIIQYSPADHFDEGYQAFREGWEEKIITRLNRQGEEKIDTEWLDTPLSCDLDEQWKW